MEGKQEEVWLDSNGKPILNGKDPRINNALFERYIIPNYEMVRDFVRKYSDRPENVEENFVLVLTEFYKYIQSYNPEKSIKTWIHVCVKRCCFEQNKKRFDYNAKYSDNDPRNSTVAQQHITQISAFEDTDMSDCLPDEIVTAMRMIQPHKLSAFILQVQGYTIKEITDIEFMRGHLKRRNEENVKSRIFQARKELKELLNRDGTLRSELLTVVLKQKIDGCSRETEQDSDDLPEARRKDRSKV